MTTHLKHLKIFLEVLRVQNLYANQKTCSFGVSQVEYLGHIISEHGVASDKAKTVAMQEWSSPRSVKQLRGFLGLTRYYIRFIRDYGVIALPFTIFFKKYNFICSLQA